MSNLSMKAKFARAAVGTAVIGATFASLLAAPASADPKADTALVGVGSDTIQDIGNAFAGYNNGIFYTPVHSTTASGDRTIKSYEATAPVGGSACISPKPGSPSFNRPNGSTVGRRALSRAIDGTPFGDATCGGAKTVTGQVDFARSSSGPANGDLGTTLTYIPFGRDGVSFATYRAAGSPVTTLTRAELNTIFSSTTGATTINGVRILPCGIQTGSGTFAFWNGAIGVSAAQENTATNECNDLLGADVRAQENDGASLKARGDAAEAANPGTQVIIGFSAAAFIAKSNGVTDGVPPAGVGMGGISDNGSGTNLGSPISGTAPTLTASATFYNDTTFGRNVYHVLQTSKIDAVVGFNDLKTLFKGSTSAVCQATGTINAFGFLTIGTCGASTLKGSLIAGTI